ncbi:hypothetical protein [Nocardiopsis coralliicola]
MPPLDRRRRRAITVTATAAAALAAAVGLLFDPLSAAALVAAAVLVAVTGALVWWATGGIRPERAVTALVLLVWGACAVGGILGSAAASPLRPQPLVATQSMTPNPFETTTDFGWFAYSPPPDASAPSDLPASSGPPEGAGLAGEGTSTGTMVLPPAFSDPHRTLGLGLGWFPALGAAIAYRRTRPAGGAAAATSSAIEDAGPQQPDS